MIAVAQDPPRGGDYNRVPVYFRLKHLSGPLKGCASWLKKKPLTREKKYLEPLLLDTRRAGKKLYSFVILARLSRKAI